MSNRAWVTLATNDSYGLGALVLANSLRRVGSEHPSVVLITPSVTLPMRERLGAVFAEVITVDVLDSGDATHLALLQRPELGITFTKIHCWNLVQYEKCVFLDADALVVQNCDELFEREEFSAAPDVGWPDCFNSGVFVFKPSSETFEKLVKFAQERGSFDGGDQGLLNSFFSDWARGDISRHLPFLYNVTSAAFYSYLPALKHYGQDLKIIHFIGTSKPWLQRYNFDSRTVEAPDHLRQYLQMWWDVFVSQVHAQLDVNMGQVEDDQEEERIEEVDPIAPPQDTLYHYLPQLDSESEFPWHHPEDENDEEEFELSDLDMNQFYDPWQYYRGNTDSTNSTDEQESYNQQLSEQSHYIHDYSNYDTKDTQNVSQCEYHSHNNFEHQQISHQSNSLEHHSFDHHSHHQNIHNSTSHVYDFSDNNNHNDKTDIVQSSHDHYVEGSSYSDHNHSTQTFQCNSGSQKYETHLQSVAPIQHVYCVHLDHEKRIKYKSSLTQIPEDGYVNGNISETESEDFDDIIPRHPYDGFYLRHRATIDPRGHKICLHEVRRTPSPTLSFECLTPLESRSPSPTNEVESKICENVDQTGVAGNLARVAPGSTAPQQEALDELSRRQGWETGNIDFMGADSFDNIWAKISQTLTRSSPPKETKEPSPPPKQPSPPKEVAPVVEASPDVIPSAEVVETAVIATEAFAKEVSELSISEPKSESLPVNPPAISVESQAKVEKKISEPVAQASLPIEECEVVSVEPMIEPSKPVEECKAISVEPVLEASIPAVSKTETDSPPLANTPSKEEIPSVPSSKSEERRRGAGIKLQLSVPTAVIDAQPTPDSEFEDAATLASSIIASELRTPTVIEPSPQPLNSPPALQEDNTLSVEEPEIPTPPVSLEQIGVKPLKKQSTACQIESSVVEKDVDTPPVASEPSAPAGTPKKKSVKKVVKKSGESSTDAPVPPPRKKEKKPKDK